MAPLQPTPQASNRTVSPVIEVVLADNWFAERHRGMLEIRDKDSYQLIRAISPPADWELWNWKVGEDGRSVVFHH